MLRVKTYPHSSTQLPSWGQISWAGKDACVRMCLRPSPGLHTHTESGRLFTSGATVAEPGLRRRTNNLRLFQLTLELEVRASLSQGFLERAYRPAGTHALWDSQECARALRNPCGRLMFQFLHLSSWWVCRWFQLLSTPSSFITGDVPDIGLNTCLLPVHWERRGHSAWLKSGQLKRSSRSGACQGRTRQVTRCQFVGNGALRASQPCSCPSVPGMGLRFLWATVELYGVGGGAK